jgi:uncharacterized membrane protein YfcA
MLTVGAVIVAVLATLLGATVQGSLGFGMNLVTVPALALVLPESLPVAVIVLGFPNSVAMLRHEHHALDRAGVAWITAGRLPGTLIGTLIVATVSTTALQGFVGVVVLALVASSAVMPALPVRARSQVVAGGVSGVTGTAAGIGGPPLALLYQHHPGPTMRSTLAASFLLGTFLSLGTLAVAGQVELEPFVLGVALAPFVVLGTVIGRRLHDWLDRGWLRPAVLGFAALSAATVLVHALT